MGNEKCEGCYFYIDSHCTKYRKNGKPNPSSITWLIRDKYDEPIHFIPADRICFYESLFGNEYLGLSQADIDKIQNGEVACVLIGEYKVFVGFNGLKGE